MGPKARIFMRTAAIALAGAAVAAAPGLAQDRVSVPSGLCDWDWASPATDSLLGQLAARDDFNGNMRYIAAECPQVLCDADWAGAGAQAAIAQMGGRTYLEALIDPLSEACPQVALLITEGATAAGAAEEMGDKQPTGGDAAPCIPTPENPCEEPEEPQQPDYPEEEVTVVPD